MSDIILSQAFSLLDEASVIIRIAEAKREGNITRNFNIFEILDRARDEVKGHSKFLEVLLNPHGVHGLDDAFLQIFIDEVNSACSLDLITDSSTIVEREKPASSKGDSGRIDLYIETDKYIIVIENKIDAGDQDRQLERYVNYAESNASGIKKVCAIYLTLDGREPSKNARGRVDLSQIHCLSYEIFILGFLEKCIKESANYHAVRESINQYRNLVIKITRGNFDMDDLNEISKNIDAPEKLRAALLISKSVEKKRADIEKEFWVELELALKEKLNVRGIKFVIPIFGKFDDGKIVKGTGYYGIWISIYERDNLDFCFNVNRESGVLYQGLRILENKLSKVVHIKGQEELFLELNGKLKPVFKDGRVDDSWIIWNEQATVPRINMKDVNDEFISLIDSKDRRVYIDKYSNEVVELIENSIEVLNEPLAIS